MNSKVENIEKNVATIKIEVSPEKFNEAINKAYNKNKKRFAIHGFRKGKVPRHVIEMHYGEGIFYEDALDIAFPEAFMSAINEHDIEPVSRPEFKGIETMSSKEGVVFTVSVAIKPDVELGEYIATDIESLEYSVTEEDIKEELEKIQDQNARLVSIDEGEVKEGNTVIIDFEGFVNGEAFEGGKAEGYSLVIGSGAFIPGFEEQLIGAKINDEVEVNVTFPEEYQAKNLAGQKALFKVKVHEIKLKELPELDDEFAKDVSEFDTLDELKEDSKSKIKEKKENQLKVKAEEKVIKVAIENSKMDIPEAMVEEEIERTIKDYENQLKTQGINLEDYFNYANINESDFKEGLRDDALNKIKTDLVLNKISSEEKIEASSDEVDEEIAKYAKMYGQETDKFKESINDSQRSYFEELVLRRKTIDFLVNSAIVK